MTSRYVPRVCGNSFSVRVHTLEATHMPCPFPLNAGAIGGPETVTSASFWPHAGEATRHSAREASANRAMRNKGDFKAAPACGKPLTNSILRPSGRQARFVTWHVEI